MDEMTVAFAREVFSRAGVRGFREKLLQTVKSIRPTIDYNELTSSYSIPVGISEIKEPQRTLEEILSILDSLKKPVVIAIDEFPCLPDIIWPGGFQFCPDSQQCLEKK